MLCFGLTERDREPSSRVKTVSPIRFTNDPFVLTPEPDVGSSLEVCRASVPRRNAAMNAEIYRYPLALPASTFPRCGCRCIPLLRSGTMSCECHVFETHVHRDRPETVRDSTCRTAPVPVAVVRGSPRSDFQSDSEESQAVRMRIPRSRNRCPQRTHADTLCYQEQCGPHSS